MYSYIKEKELWLPVVASMSVGFWLFHSLNTRPTGEDSIASPIFIIAALACVVLLAILVVAKVAAGEAKVSRQVFFLTLLLLTYFYICIASVWGSVETSVSVKRIVLTHTPVIVCLFSLAISSEYAVRRVFNGFMMLLVWVTVFLVVVALLISFFGVYFYEAEVGAVQQIQIGPFKLGQRAMGYPPLYRVSSLTGNPNQFGLLVSISIVSALYFKRLGVMRSKPKFYFLFLVLLVGLGMSQSRTALISSFMAVILFGFLISRNKKKFAPTVVLGVGVIMVLALLSAIQSEGAIGQSSRLTMTLSGRDQIWSEVLGAFYNSPMLGIGFGAAGNYLTLQGADNVSVHSFYLQQLSEVGLLGFVSFFVFLVAVFLNVFVRWRTETDNVSACFYAAVLAIFILVLTNQITESSLYRGVFLHFFFFFVLSCGLSRREKSLCDRRSCSGSR